MSYALGIDVGTSFTAAFVLKDDRPTMVALGLHSVEMPSAVGVRDDQIVVGEAALRLAETRPELVATEFKRRFGDPVPLQIAGRTFSAGELTAALLEHVIATATSAEGERPDSVTVTHPAGWGSFKLDILDDVLSNLGLEHISRVAEPVAAAHHFMSRDRIPADATLAVFDFGGGTFDAAIVGPAGDGQLTVFESRGIERLGGVDLDHAVLDHVMRALELDLSELGDDAATRSSMRRLRSDVTDAKEALSHARDTSIVAMIPGHHGQVDLSRRRFEEMIAPSVEAAFETLDATVHAAGVEHDGLDAVLLVGGSSRIPLVDEMAASRFGDRVLTDVSPKHGVAIGAARYGSARRAASNPSREPRPQTDPQDRTAPAELEPSPPRPRRRTLLALAIACFVALLATVAWTRLRTNDPLQSAVSEAGESEDGAATAVPDGTSSTDERTPAIGLRDDGSRPSLRRHVGAGPDGIPNLLWSVDDSRAFSPIGSGDSLFFDAGTFPDTVIVARDVATGEELWSLDHQTFGQLVLTADYVLAPGPERVSVVDKTTGSIAGAVLDGAIGDTLGAFALRGERLYAVRTVGFEPPRAHIEAFDSLTLDPMWEFDLGEPANKLAFELFVDDQTVVVGTEHEGLIAVDGGSGVELWRAPSIDPFNVKIMDEGVLVVSTDDGLDGLDARSGERVWSTGTLYFGPFATDGVALFGYDFDRHVTALSLQTGAELWTVSPGPRPRDMTLTLADARLIAVQVDGTLTVHDPASGEILDIGQLDGLPELTRAPDAVIVVGEHIAVRHLGATFVYGMDATGRADGEASTSPVESALARIQDVDAVVSAHRSFDNGGEPFVEPGPLTEPRLLWSINRSVSGVPAIVAAGLVLFTDDRTRPDGESELHVVAVDARTGADVWSQMTPPAFGLHVAGDVVFVQSTDGLQALDLESGESLASFEDIGLPAGNPAIRRGALIVGSKSRGSSNQQYFIDSIDLATGDANWLFTDASTNDNLGHVYVGETAAVLVNAGALIGVDLDSGQELWRSDAYNARSFEFIEGDILYVSELGQFQTVDARTGERMGVSPWRRIFTVHDESMHYVIERSINPRVQAFANTDDREVWNVPSPTGDSPAEILVAGDAIYVINEELGMAAHQRSDGAVIWTRDNDGETPRFGRSAAIGSGVIVVSEESRVSVYG